MAKLVSEKKLSEDGKNWLTLALDPFHDFNHQPAGYPDADGSQTIVSCYQYQRDIAAPAGVPGNWDCHVFSLPVAAQMAGVAMYSSADWSTIYTPVAGVFAPICPLNIYSNATGTALLPTIPATANASHLGLPAAGALELESGVTRIIGMGFEVTNTTADINKQGAVTVYRMPQYSSDTCNGSYSNGAGTRVAAVQYKRWKQAPANIAEVNLLKGTRTWAAEHGVYATCVQNSVVNPMAQLGTTTAVFDREEGPPGVVTQIMATPLTEVIGNVGPALSTFAGTISKFTPFDTTGAYFTGLSNATTLTVKLKVYVERAPCQSEPEMVVLATPSAALDTTALELYSHAISQLPVAVTVGENGMGDWFRGVLNVLKNVAGDTGSLLTPFVPGAGIAGKAIQQIAGGMDNLIYRRRQQPAPAVMPRPGPRVKSKDKTKVKMRPLKK